MRQHSERGRLVLTIPTSPHIEIQYVARAFSSTSSASPLHSPERLQIQNEPSGLTYLHRTWPECWLRLQNPFSSSLLLPSASLLYLSLAAARWLLLRAPLCSTCCSASHCHLLSASSVSVSPPDTTTPLAPSVTRVAGDTSKPAQEKHRKRKGRLGLCPLEKQYFMPADAVSDHEGRWKSKDGKARIIARVPAHLRAADTTEIDSRWFIDEDDGDEDFQQPSSVQQPTSVQQHTNVSQLSARNSGEGEVSDVSTTAQQPGNVWQLTPQASSKRKTSAFVVPVPDERVCIDDDSDEPPDPLDTWVQGVKYSLDFLNHDKYPRTAWRSLAVQTFNEMDEIKETLRASGTDMRLIARFEQNVAATAHLCAFGQDAMVHKTSRPFHKRIIGEES